MFETLGWFALACGGAWLFGRLAALLFDGTSANGVSWLPRGFQVGILVAIAWIALVVWWSPLNIGAQ